MNKNNAVKIMPPKRSNINTVTSSPASSRATESVEDKPIQIKVSQAKHIEIKAYAVERGESLKELFLRLFENEKKRANR